MINEEILKKRYKILDKKEKNEDILYLCKFEDDECYLIIGIDLYEHAELRMPLFDDKMAKKIFNLL